MRLGIVQIVDGTPGRGLELVQETAGTAEQLGFSSYWAPDHLLFFDRLTSRYPHSEDGAFAFKPDQGLLEPLLVLGAAAAVTSTIALGTSVEVVPLRHPVERAKQVATLDHLCGGRFVYGIGVGWMREEFDACGVDFATRGRRADEFLAAVKALWTQSRATFDGTFFSFHDAIAFPKPLQEPHPPVLVGGTTRAGIRRAVRHDGWYGWKLTLPELDSCLDILDEELEAVGRSRDGFRLYLGTPHHGDPRDLGGYVEAVRARGVEELVLGLALSRRRVAEQLAAYAELVPVATV